MSVEIDKRIYELIQKRDGALEALGNVPDYQHGVHGYDTYTAMKAKQSLSVAEKKLSIVENELINEMRSAYPDCIIEGDVQGSIVQFMSDIARPVAAPRIWAINPGR